MRACGGCAAGARTSRMGTAFGRAVCSRCLSLRTSPQPLDLKPAYHPNPRPGGKHTETNLDHEQELTVMAVPMILPHVTHTAVRLEFPHDGITDLALDLMHDEPG